jgi:cytidylate kinase
MGVANMIAIDGPAGSGKSTLGEMLADYLGYLYFDSGVMYRAVTWYALQNGIPVEDESAVTQLARQLDIDVLPADRQNGRRYKVLVESQDITYEIRSPEVESNVSVVSAYPGVRRALSTQQRRIGLRGQVVMVGRDIGTVVLPEADLKIYLDASVEERARRRYNELRERHENASLPAILDSMRKRDRIDSTREIAPLRVAEDAILLETDGLEIIQVFDRLKELAEEGCD